MQSSVSRDSKQPPNRDPNVTRFCHASASTRSFAHKLTTMSDGNGTRSPLHPPPQHNNHAAVVSDQENNHPFRVQGIAFVVDQKGKEPKLVFRYPATPPQGISDEEDLFFRMDSRQMAKLFRPKSSLCGEPVTLSVGVTIFCCRAVLLEQQDETDDNPDDPPVELFSIIVALVPRAREPSMTTNAGGWYEEERNIQGIWGGSTQPSSNHHSSKVWASLLAVVRVHVSLARICPILEQEEANCHYVTLQTKLCLDTRKSFRIPPPSSSPSGESAATPSVVVPTVSSLRPPSRNSQLSSNASMDHWSNNNRPHWTDSADGLATEVETAMRDQETLDAIVSAPAPVDSRTGVTHQGNLVRELIHLFHALGRNEDEYAPTPLMLLGGEGVVHVNGHIAVAVEAVAPRTLGDRETGQVVRPYQTLLFPHTSTQDLLEALSSSTSSSSSSSSSSTCSSLSPPPQVHQFLRAATPRKSLVDIAKDAGLTLDKTMEIANYLVQQGVSLSSSVLTRHCRLASVGMQPIHTATVPFSYTFGLDVHVFHLVAFLTTPGWTLGEAIQALVSSSPQSLEAQQLRTKLQCCLALRPERNHNHNNTNSATEDHDKLAGVTSAPVEGAASWRLPPAPHQSRNLEEAALVDLVYDMVAWLCGHRVVTHLQEYLVESTFGSEGTIPHSLTTTTTTSTTGESNNNTASSSLYHELRAADGLSGRASLPALSWRLGVSVDRLRSWVLDQNKKDSSNTRSLCIRTRPSAPGDDWIPVTMDPKAVLQELRHTPPTFAS